MKSPERLKLRFGKDIVTLTRQYVHPRMLDHLSHFQAAYGNEAEVGAGIKASGIPRKEIWITTKLNNPDHKRVAAALDDSLSKLGVDYVDLYLMHWPSSTDPSDTNKIYTDWDFTNTWAEMQKLPATGKVRNIGVSNFVEKNLQKLFSSSDFKVRCGTHISQGTNPLTINRSPPPSIRLNCTLITPRQNSSSSTHPAVFTPPATPVLAAPTRHSSSPTSS